MISRSAVCWVACGMMAAAASRATADEPSYRGRTLTEWRTMLESDPKPEKRQAAVLVIEVLGAKEPVTIRAVGKAARADSNDDVRLAAAQLLVNLGADAREAMDDLAA